MGEIRKIQKSEINLNRIYNNKYDADNMSNALRANVKYWGDDLTLETTDDPNVGIVYQNGIGIAYVNLNELTPIEQSFQANEQQEKEKETLTFDSSEYFKQVEEANKPKAEEVAPAPTPEEPVQEAPMESIQNVEEPVSTPVEETPVEEEPAQEAPMESIQNVEDPVSTPVEETPVEEETSIPEETPMESIENVEEPTTPVEETFEEENEDEIYEGDIPIIENVENEEFVPNPEDIEQEYEETPEPGEMQTLEEIESDWIPPERDENASGHTFYTYDPSNGGIAPSGIPYVQSIVPSTLCSASAAASLGKMTYGNQNYTVVPDGEYIQAPGTISESDYNLLAEVICGEGGVSPDDMMAVGCTILNRLEDPSKPNTILGVLEDGYFPWGRTYLKYEPGGSEYGTAAGQARLAQGYQIVNDLLSGCRNVQSNVYSYGGHGTYNAFYDS